MGFSTSLQGQSSHEALLARQDAEIKLLETMRRCLTIKVKSDREYASTISSLTMQGKKIERNEDLVGSLIAQSWRDIMDSIDQTAKLIKQQADSIEAIVVEHIMTLYSERRRARKVYQEEQTWLNNQFQQLTEDVARKKLEYQKNLEMYKLMRSRFEEHYVKSGRVGRKLDEVREKYQKACRKLHLTHNEYVLLLGAVTECEHDLRTCYLPSLLHRQQAIHQEFITSWKTILQDIVKYSDFTTDKFQEIHRRMQKAVDSVKPVEEYRDFIGKHRTRPASPIRFIFDENLVDDTSGKLLPNKLTVDNLTIDWLRNRLTELETSLKATQQSRQNPPYPSENNSDSKISILDYSREREELRLRCQEKRLQRQVDVIRAALNELGCEELPLGYDLSMESSFADSPSISKKNTVADIGLFTLRRNQRFMTIFRSPFKSLPIINDTKDGTIRSSSEGPTSKADNTLPVTFRGISHLTSQKGNGSGDLMEEEWFHGVLPREEVVRLLVTEGDFLVRETTRNDECQIVLSVCWDGHKHFIVQTTPEGHYRFEGPTFPSIQELIRHQWLSGLPVTSRSGAILKTPILRERWELNNDDGNFGDVYKAQLKTCKTEVAVKTCKVTLPDEQKRKFLQEGRILKQYDHPNIVKLIGICVQKQPIMIVMELVPGGSLLTYLRKNANTITQQEQLRMCKDAAAGMRYLESKYCIHRDLAARNCLVGYESIVKISDFGMSREEEEYIVSDGMKQIPIKWTAPEALNFGKYTSLCDVWSYGILMWEIFSKGGNPYSGMSNSQAREKIDAGYRMPAPENTPDEIYRLMLRCWEYEPEKRPHFDQIYTVVETLSQAYL
ncbi:tyrosine-protein kinase Fer isoform X2 [Bombus vosnesenskii]|uniref:Tyrosine-protein kinase n=3 Tax=Bombus TaxID=28641 RepID=A0A6J3K1U1_9HYME|nr:tyrosine-protein kinase Fer isoform X2 [Bombus terrestris]XP_033189726.1 tyrosine-protein kinase Fer isoform X2 [Bombus vancouverensis nearcticus]XP_033303580.1 tyrosine-protein kinase Fer isoform X2 [Bombus bifarius]XP_033347042.1 tyrosine-protein kinase Fer isoform X2 [Bombus vosnesenskii]XP_043580071.1 tyrosine-protein kinase Fer isoform X2 [Bombus pyrosoma]XP_050478652.1 tyrosine-protein kinase Fer isoform X2 [Bombus huntii]XP_050574391.1 tyrosine-protein kinase Fer isoform X2 [Bombus 